MASVKTRRARVALGITEAAMQALFRDGPTATVESVAELADVSRATVFRHFASRDELLAAGLAHAYEGLTASLPAWQRGSDPDVWTTEAVTAIVSRSLRGGLGYLRTILDPGDGALAEVVATRRDRRRAISRSLADGLWRAHQGGRRAPVSVIRSVDLLTGPYAIHALHVDLGMAEADIVGHLSWTLRATVEAAARGTTTIGSGQRLEGTVDVGDRVVEVEREAKTPGP